MTIAAIERPTIPPITEFPETFGGIPALHRGVLALIAANEDETGSPLAWLRLVSLVKAARLENLEPYTEFVAGSLVPSVVTVLNDLDNLGVIDTTRTGLTLSERSKAVRAAWNGEFTEMVERATKLV
ncbi:hypothetical protein ASE12_11900 [Aeromicrobium sp. Root236]|uniref:hypothetical protein n=1 Tax=Aeromicrobium sp. Root236 TaxID=1736498 RepID=UPI0006FCB993|nr:hypothetical protein [Aeromicrobium sp. Root236]KRC65394.1 hypothetical protein ASE12_11900 [Aeromicrobium sp. Root236]